MSTIYDIAKLVGVSSCAVSRVLNDKPVRVSDATRQRIFDAAKSLNYTANLAAQQLKTGKFDAIAVCFERSSPDFYLNPMTNQLTAGIGHSALQANLSLSLRPTEVYEAISSLPLQGADGGIVVGPFPSDKPVSVINNCNVPLVCIGSHPRLESASTVDTDNTAAMKMGTQHLIASGHRKIAYISYPPVFYCLLDRMGGFYEAVKDAELSIADQSVSMASVEEVPAVVRRLVETVDGPTALICADRDTGEAVLNEVMRIGLRIPEDLSILVYDDISEHPLAGSISIMRSNFYEMGVAAGDLLRKLINGECSGPVSVWLPVEFVQRRG